MLSSARKKDLDVFYNICVSDKTTFLQVGQATKIPIRNIKTIITRLNMNILQYFNRNEFIIVSSQNGISINPLFFVERFEILFQLRLTLYKDSPQFNLLVLMCSSKKITKNKARNHLFLSDSGLKSTVTKLNRYLESYGIKVSLKNGIFVFVGDEFRIRVFLFNCFYHIYLNLEWPFSESKITQLKEDFSLQVDQSKIFESDILLRGISIFIVILDYRYSEENFLSNAPSSDLLEVLTVFRNRRSWSSYANRSLKSVPVDSREIEELIIELCLRVFIPEIDSEQVDLGKLLANTNNALTSLAVRLIDSLDETFGIQKKDESKYTRIYQLIVFISLYLFSKDALVPFIYMHFPKPIYHLNTNDSYMRIIKSIVQNSGEHSYQFINLISSFCYSLYKTDFSKKVVLYLEFSKDTTATYVVKKRLQSIFNIQSLSFTDNIKTADLIVSDTYDTKKDPYSFFYLNNTNNKAAWKSLLLKMQHLLAEKCLE